jgi:hypothetical protein
MGPDPHARKHKSLGPLGALDGYAKRGQGVRESMPPHIPYPSGESAGAESLILFAWHSRGEAEPDGGIVDWTTLPLSSGWPAGVIQAGQLHRTRELPEVQFAVLRYIRMTARAGNASAEDSLVLDCHVRAWLRSLAELERFVCAAAMTGFLCCRLLSE